MSRLIAAWEIREAARRALELRLKGLRTASLPRGRPPKNIPVKIIYDTLKQSYTVSEAAENLGISRAYIYQRFRQPDKLLLGVGACRG